MHISMVENQTKYLPIRKYAVPQGQKCVVVSAKQDKEFEN
jgi:hypothetical protein